MKTIKIIYATHIKPHSLAFLLLLCSIILALFSCRNESQSSPQSYNDCYYLKTAIAKKLFKKKRTKEAFLFYLSAEKESGLLLKEDCLRMAGSCLQLGKETEGQQYLKEAVSQGYSIENVKKKKYLQAFLPLINSSNLAGIESNYKKNLRLPYTQFIDSLIKIDGNVREKYPEELIWKDVAVSDSLNAMAFLGWLNNDLGNLPVQYQLDNEAKLQTYALILHASYHEALNKQFVAIADHIIKIGYVEPYLYDYLIQRSEKAMGKPVKCRISTRVIPAEDLKKFDNINPREYLLEHSDCQL